MLFYIFFFKISSAWNHHHWFVACWGLERRASLSIYKLANSSFFLWVLCLFWLNFSDMILYYLKKKKHICKKPLVFVCCPLKLGSKASPLIYRLAKSLFFYELFAFLAPYDCSISFRLVGIRLASHLYLFSIKYDLHLYLFFSWLFLSFI
jgi:hypothetical protein